MANSDNTVPPAGDSFTGNNECPPSLSEDSYTFHRLKHASPNHLHLTTRRFFIGPIPQGWLNSNRKSWYRRRLELSNYSSKQVSFNVVGPSGLRARTLSGSQDHLPTAPIGVSFPQPDDVDDDPDEAEVEINRHDGSESRFDSETEEIAKASSPKAILAVPDPPTLDGRNNNLLEAPGPSQTPATSLPEASFHTANQSFGKASNDLSPVDNNEDTARSPSQRTITNHFLHRSSKTPLLQPDSPPGPRARTNSSVTTQRKGSIEPQSLEPIPHDQPELRSSRTFPAVRFNVTDNVVDTSRLVRDKVHNARQQLANPLFQRNSLQEGTIIKMERMLVKVYFTAQPVPRDFDENAAQAIETRTIEKWQEFMVVTRKSRKEEAEDVRLQIYNTRVIPEIDNEQTRKKPTREMRLDPKTTHINLYSTLDKSVVIWHPYRGGTRIVIMRPSSTAHSVEWYTFLHDVMGSKRQKTLVVDVPNLGVKLRLDSPFESLENANLAATINDQSTLVRPEETQQAVAKRIIAQCMEMLETSPEWSAIFKTWKETSKMGLAWRRYDRLEWIHGVTEQHMHGSMAMNHTHELELRPKHHYPTSTVGKKGVRHYEPPPIEGFLIRLTSQKGRHQRMGKNFFKRLYFYTEDDLLLFARPAKATPPHPPFLTTGTGPIPSSHEIASRSPLMYDIEPFKTKDGHIPWLHSGNNATIKHYDTQALEEARRNLANLSEAEGYISMRRIKKVRKIKRHAAPEDAPPAESDFEFYDEDENEDDGEEEEEEEDDDDDDDNESARGSLSKSHDDRIFELVLDNGLVLRLQAYSKATRKAWIKRLRELIKYWKRRNKADANTFKQVRKTNLDRLKIDEEMEANLGQFGRKWEVNQAEASPEIYHMCGISSCRAVTVAGTLYRKPRRRGTFERCSVILSGGKMLIFQAAVRRMTGKIVRHVHNRRIEVIDLKNCYVYSGLVVDDDLVYQNSAFDANKPGGGGLPRLYRRDGSTTQDADVMTCFVVWKNNTKSWFKMEDASQGGDGDDAPEEASDRNTEGKRARLKRVAKLGVAGKGMVFKCRSRVERDHWVLCLSNEIERIVEMDESSHWQSEDYRLKTGGGHAGHSHGHSHT